MIVREATLQDRSAILRISIEQTKRYPRLRKDVDKIHTAITEVIGDSKHYAAVVEQDGEVKGAILCISADALWSQRRICNIALWVSKVPGGGGKLLRSFKFWVKGTRAIKVAGMCPDLDLDPRILKIAERNGFKRHGGSYLLHN